MTDSKNYVEVNDHNFTTEVLNSKDPVLIDFWAPWCGPCRLVGPMVEEIAGEYAGRLKVGKLNVDENGNTAYKYGIRSIPTIMLFRGGRPVDQIVGAVPKHVLKNMIERNIKSN